MTNEVLKETKDLLKGKWWKFFGVYLLTMVIAGFGGGIIGGVLSLVISNDIVGMIVSATLGMLLGSMFGYGLAKYFFDARNKEEKLLTIFYAFSHFVDYLKFLASALIFVIAIYAASLIVCLVLAGIALVPIAGILLSVVLYIAYLVFVVMVSLLYTFFMYKNFEGCGVIESLRESRKIASGHKWFIFWTPIKLALVPIIIMLVALALFVPGMAATVIAVMSSEAGTAAGGGIMVLLGVILLLVSEIWLLILMPRICLVCPVMYDKLNVKKETEEIVE